MKSLSVLIIITIVMFAITISVNAQCLKTIILPEIWTAS